MPEPVAHSPSSPKPDQPLPPPPRYAAPDIIVPSLVAKRSPKARPTPPRAARATKRLATRTTSRARPAHTPAKASASTPAIKPPKPPATSPDYQARLARLQARATQLDLDHTLITNPLDVGYLTGFLGGDSWLFLGSAAGPKQALIISDGRYDEELRPFHHLLDVAIRTKPMPAAAAETLAHAHVRRCGIQSDHLSLAEHDTLARALGPDLAARLTPIPSLVSALREIKDDHEVALIESAIRIQEAALLATIPELRPGRSELDVAAQLEMEMKRRGSSRCWFDSIIAAKANGALPHYRPASEKTANNRPLLIDWGATFHGYCGDMTRTFCFGAWPHKLREVYEIVREAQELAAAALAPGKSTHEIDAIARAHISKHGYGEYFNHGLGHGLGLSKEPPYLNPLYPDMQLRPGHVCTIEPGIYLPGLGGVRIEDQYVVTPRGARNLCTLPKTLAWSTL